MSAKYTTQIKISAFNDTGRAFAGVNQNIDATMAKLSQIQRRMGVMGRDAVAAGASLGAAFTLPAVTVGDGVLKTAKAYEGASARLASTLGTSINGIGKLQSQADRLAGSTIFSAAEIIGAQTEAAMAGFNEAQIMTAVPGVLKFATMADIEIPTAAELSSDVLRGYAMDVGRLPDILDQVAYASTKANQNSQQFMRGLVRFAPIANQMNMPLERSVAILSELADSGFKAGEGGNALRTMMLRMAAPTKAAREAMAGLGIDLANFRTGGAASADGVMAAMVQAGVATAGQLESIKGRIQTALEIEPPRGMTRQQAISDVLTSELGLIGDDGAQVVRALGAYLDQQAGGTDTMGLLRAINERLQQTGQDPLAVINAVFGKQRAAQGAVLLKQIESILAREEDIAAKSGGASGRMFETVMKQIANDLKILQSAREAFYMAAWKSGVGDVFSGWVKWGQSVLNTLAQLQPATLLAGAKFATLAATIGPAVLALGAFTRIAAFALAPFGALVSMLALGAVRAAAFAVSLVSLRTLRLLVSPLGVVALAVAGFGASLWGVVSQSPVIREHLGKIQAEFGKLSSAFKAGNMKAVSVILGDLKSAAGGLVGALGEVGREWMRSTPAGQRFLAIAESLRRIFNNVKNAISNTTAAVGGFFDGIAKGLGFTGDVEAATTPMQQLVQWFVDTLAALTAVSDNSAALGASFAALGEAIGGFVRRALTPLGEALVVIKGAFDALVQSDAWRAFERFLGLDAGQTVESINSITSAIGSLTRGLLALGLASVGLLGLRRTFGMLRGLTGAGGRAAGAAAGVGGAAGRGAAGAAGRGAGLGAVVAGAGRWFARLMPIMGALNIASQEQKNTARRLELVTKGLSPQEAAGQVMRENAEAFEQSAVGRFLTAIGTPLAQIGERINSAIGLPAGASMWDALRGAVPPPAPSPAAQQAALDAHSILDVPAVRRALNIGGGSDAGLFTGLKNAAQGFPQMAPVVPAPALPSFQEPAAPAAMIEAAAAPAAMVIGDQMELQATPRTDEAGTLRDMLDQKQQGAADLRALTEAVGQLIEQIGAGKVKAEVDGEVRVAVKTQPGTSVSGVASANKGPGLRLDTGVSTLAR